ncbi:NADH dehydrogenase 1 alpha subcomplex assembly factor 3 [Phlyctochytrium arcticum]|nr:NADH dehydrogenase 1 alpha subcomplex assembly factor 3 [Phlyctochytrium arcticum]
MFANHARSAVARTLSSTSILAVPTALRGIIHQRQFLSTFPSLQTSQPPASKSDAESSTPSLRSFNVLSGAASSTTPSFHAVGNNSFTLGDVRLHGPVIVFAETVLMWDVPQYGVSKPVKNGETIEEGAASIVEGSGRNVVNEPSSPFHVWSTDVFKIFELCQPVPDILVIGSGARTVPLPPFLRSHLLNLGIQVEVQASRQAASTYNILLQEGRRPAAALLPAIPTSARTGKVLVEFGRPQSDRDRERQRLQREKDYQQVVQ